MMPEALPLSVLKACWRSLSEAMPAATAGDVEAIHRARVASRRLREALPVLSAGGPHAAVGHLRKRVRLVTRALGPVRELDVALQHLDASASHLSLSPAVLDLLRHSLVAERRRRRSAMLDRLRLVRLDRLTRRIDRLSAPAVAEGLSPETKLAEAVRRVGRRVRVLEASIDHAGALYLSDRLHAVRIAAKRLRYAMEVERDLRQSRAANRFARLKKVQELLGRMHDTEVLIEQTRTAQAALASANIPATLELNALIRALEGECRTWHAGYLRDRTALLQLCVGVREASDAGHSTVAA